jgi:hypothetical protein
MGFVVIKVQLAQVSIQVLFLLNFIMFAHSHFIHICHWRWIIQAPDNIAEYNTFNYLNLLNAFKQLSESLYAAAVLKSINNVRNPQYSNFLSSNWQMQNTLSAGGLVRRNSH